MTAPKPDRTITLTAKICGLDHGGSGNSATVYGHYGSLRTCLRLGKTSTWIYNPVRKS